jgi:glycosyltransferase involved in cell wall biosynthesis
MGGMESVVLSLSRELSGRRWDVRTVFPANTYDAAFAAWCEEQAVVASGSRALKHLDEARSGRDVVALAAQIRAGRPDVINLHYGSSHISLKDVLAARLAGTGRCVVSLHHPERWWYGRARTRRATRLAAELAHTVVAGSDAVAEALRRGGIPERRIRVIRYGARPPARPAERAEARARLGLPAAAFIVGSVARLVPHKRIAELIDAVAQVPDAAGELVLAVAGTGPEEPGLRHRAAARLPGRAVFLGWVPDPHALYAAADVFVLPSEMEGFGLVFIEAAFHGVPSIGVAVGGVPEAIVDGQTGLLVPLGDGASLVSAIRRLRDDAPLRRRLGAAARERAYQERTADRMAAAYAATFGGPPDPA